METRGGGGERDTILRLWYMILNPKLGNSRELHSKIKVKTLTIIMFFNYMHAIEFK